MIYMYGLGHKLDMSFHKLLYFIFFIIRKLCVPLSLLSPVVTLETNPSIGPTTQFVCINEVNCSMIHNTEPYIQWIWKK